MLPFLRASVVPPLFHASLAPSEQTEAHKAETVTNGRTERSDAAPPADQIDRAGTHLGHSGGARRDLEAVQEVGRLLTRTATATESVCLIDANLGFLIAPMRNCKIEISEFGNKE